VAAAGTPVVTAVVRCALPDAVSTAQTTIKLEKNEIKRRRASSSHLGGNALFYWRKKNAVNARSNEKWFFGASAFFAGRSFRLQKELTGLRFSGFCDDSSGVGRGWKLKS
jgi:hypothetical protein